MNFFAKAWKNALDDLAEAIAQLRESTHDVWTF